MAIHDQKINKIRTEVKRAEQDVKKTKEINYRKYNNYVMEKVIEINQETSKKKKEESDKMIRDAATEAAMGIRDIAVGRASFFFPSIDKLSKRR